MKTKFKRFPAIHGGNGCRPVADVTPNAMSKIGKEINDYLRKRAGELDGVLYDFLLVVAAQRAYDASQEDGTSDWEILEEAWRLATDPGQFSGYFQGILETLMDDLTQHPGWQEYFTKEAHGMEVEAPFQSIERNRTETGPGN